MTVSIGDGSIRIGIGQIPGSRLAVDHIVSTRDHIEVTHFVDECACLRVCAGERRLPECLAQVNIVRLVRVDIGIVLLLALAVKRDACIVMLTAMSLADVIKVAFYCVIA